jgi:hypothetical protein
MGETGQGGNQQRYRRIRRLGQGGMGVVYEAEDTISGRSIALKTIRGDDPELLFRLKHEFRSLARINHENLVRLYELGLENNEFFFTMELVDGTDFASYCRSKSGDTDIDGLRFRSALAQLCRGVRALHEQGLVHRDIKPSNVLVARDGRIVIVDFGLVSLFGEIDSAAASTRIVGTAAYMAPEQARPGGQITPAADWYSVGVMLFQAITGRLPFHGPQLEVLRQKVGADAPDVRSWAPGAPDDLAALCNVLLSRDPAARAGLGLAKLLAHEQPLLHAARRTTSHVRTPFAGREDELRALAEELQAVKAGACRVVLVRGDSGIGKSALIREFLETCKASDQRLLTLTGRCYQRESIPHKAFDGLVDQLSSYWKQLSAGDAMFLLPGEPEFLLRAFPVLGRVKAMADMALLSRQVSPQEALTRSRAACRETLQRLARRVPLVLSLDDVQWIDRDSTRLVRYLTESKDPPAFLLLLASRPIEAEDPTRELLEPLVRAARTIDLGPLPDEQMRSIVRQIVGTDRSDLVEDLTHESLGSPFFGITLARYAGPRGAKGSLDLDDVLRYEIAQLSRVGRQLIELVSVAGSPLTSEILARAIHEPTTEVVAGELVKLESLHLARCAAGPRGGHFEPYHDRIREAVVGEMNVDKSRELHLDLAIALEAENNPDAEACARHFREAGEPAKAAMHARRAAEQAEHQLAFIRAANHYRICLEWAELATSERSYLHAKLADCLGNAGRGAEAAQEYLVAAKNGDPDHRLYCERRATEEFLRSGHPVRGLETLRSVLAQVDLTYPTTARALGSSLWRHGLTKWLTPRTRLKEVAAIEPHLLRKIDVCSSVAHCVGFLDPLTTSYYQGLHFHLARKAGERSRLCRAFAAEAIYASFGGGSSRHLKALLDAAGELAETAEPRARGVATYSGGVVAFMLGRWKEALDKCAKGERILRESCTGVQWELDTTMLYVLAALYIMGDLVELRQQTLHHLEQAESRGDLYALTILRGGSSHVLRLADDQPAQVAEDLASVMATWPREPFSIPRYWELLSLTNADLYVGDDTKALARFDSWKERIAKSLPLRVQVTRVRTRHARARAVLAVASGVGDRAKLLAEVVDDAESLEAEGPPWAAALATSLRAGVASIQNDQSRCLSLLEMAEDRFHQADMSLDALVARRRRGEIIGGTEGALLVAESDQWMTSRGIHNKAAFARVHAPGYKSQ